jgi:hypothetical protein
MRLRRRARGDLFARVRALGPPDWSRIADRMGEGEERVGAANGWLIGDSIGKGIDYPCTVFLTDKQGGTTGNVYIDIRPDIGLRELGEPVIELSWVGIEQAGTGTSDMRNPRFVAIQRGTGEHHGKVRGVTVDFEPSDKSFAERLGQWGAMAQRHTAFHDGIAES